MNAPTMLPETYEKPLSNYLIQMGTVHSNSNGVGTVTFAKAYASTPKIITQLFATSTGSVTTCTLSARSATGFTVQVNRSSGSSISNVSTDVEWVAIGTPA